MKQKIFFLSLILLIETINFGKFGCYTSERDNKIYYYFKQFDYFNYQLNRLETRLDRTLAYLKKQEKFKKDLLAYMQEQLTNKNCVQFDLAQYRLKIWREECCCEVGKLMRKVRRVQDQVGYEWVKRLQLDQKLAWIDHVLAHDSCPDAVQLREFADHLKIKFDQLEIVYVELKDFALTTHI